MRQLSHVDARAVGVRIRCVRIDVVAAAQRRARGCGLWLDQLAGLGHVGEAARLRVLARFVRGFVRTIHRDRRQ